MARLNGYSTFTVTQAVTSVEMSTVLMASLLRLLTSVLEEIDNPWLCRNEWGGVDIKDDIKIRKLTPCECWKLMGFTEEDFLKAKEVNSDTQLYKQAGNSIVVQVLEAIFKQML